MCILAEFAYVAGYVMTGNRQTENTLGLSQSGYTHYLKMLPKTISSIDGSTLAAVERCFGAVDPLLPHVFH